MRIMHLLTFVFISTISSIANASVIDVVTDGESDFGHDGTSSDPLQWLNECIELKLVLNHNPYPGYPSYDGYLLSWMDVTLSLSGPGTFERYAGKSGWAPIPGNQIQLTATPVAPVRGPADIPLNNPTLGTILGLRYVASDGPGGIVLDLNINGGGGEYSPYGFPDGTPYPGWWLPITDEDLGDLLIHSNVPEPLSLSLIGLGCLFMRRRKRH